MCNKNILHFWLFFKIYLIFLLKGRLFIFLFIALSVLGFLLIPSENAEYVTFYIGNKAIRANEYWLAPFAAVMSNIVLFPLVIFSMINQKSKDEKSMISVNANLSINHLFVIHLHNIIRVFAFWCCLFLLFNLSIMASNIHNTNIVYHLMQLLYFTVPFLFLNCTIAYFIEFFIKKNWLKFSIYFLVYFILILNDESFFNFIGINELFLNVSELTSVSEHFAIGYLNKELVSETLEFTKYLYECP